MNEQDSSRTRPYVSSGGWHPHGADSAFSGYFALKRVGRVTPAGPVMTWVKAAALSGDSGPT
jgi:hypothetical protein